MIMCGNGDDKMKFSWIIIFVLLASMVVATQQYYEADILYSNESYTLLDLNVIPLTEDPGYESGDIVVALLDEEKKVLNLSIYPFSTKLYVWDENGQETVIEQEEFVFTVYVPYQMASTLVVYDEDLNSLVRHSLEEEQEKLEKKISDGIEESSVVAGGVNKGLLITFIVAAVVVLLALIILTFKRRET